MSVHDVAHSVVLFPRRGPAGRNGSATETARPVRLGTVEAGGWWPHLLPPASATFAEVLALLRDPR